MKSVILAWRHQATWRQELSSCQQLFFGLRPQDCGYIFGDERSVPQGYSHSAMFHPYRWSQQILEIEVVSRCGTMQKDHTWINDQQKATLPRWPEGLVEWLELAAGRTGQGALGCQGRHVLMGVLNGSQAWALFRQAKRKRKQIQKTFLGFGFQWGLACNRKRQLLGWCLDLASCANARCLGI